MKFYAVKQGKVTGLFDNWAACKESVDGFKGAVYKSFSDIDGACKYLNIPVPDKYKSETKVVVNNVGGVDEDACPPWEEPQVRLKGPYACIHAISSVTGICYGWELVGSDGVVVLRRMTLCNVTSVQSVRAGEVQAITDLFNYVKKAALQLNTLDLYCSYDGYENWFKGYWKATSETASQFMSVVTGLGFELTVREWDSRLDYFKSMMDVVGK